MLLSERTSLTTVELSKEALSPDELDASFETGLSATEETSPFATNAKPPATKPIATIINVIIAILLIFSPP